MKKPIISLAFLMFLLASCGREMSLDDHSAMFRGTWGITEAVVNEDTGWPNSYDLGDLVWFSEDGVEEKEYLDTPFHDLAYIEHRIEGSELSNEIENRTCSYHYRWEQVMPPDDNGYLHDIRATFVIIDDNTMTGWIRSMERDSGRIEDVDDVTMVLTKISDDWVGNPRTLRF